MYTNKKIVSALLGASIASRALKVISSLLLIIIMCANASLWSAEWSADWDSLDGWDANSEEYCGLTHCLPVGAASGSFDPCDSRDMRNGLKDPLLSSVNRNRGTKRNQDDEYFFLKRAPAPDGTFYPSAASLCPDQLTELFGGQQETSAQVQEETDYYQQEVGENHDFANCTFDQPNYTGNSPLDDDSYHRQQLRDFLATLLDSSDMFGGLKEVDDETAVDARVADEATVDGNVDVATAPQTAATRDQSWMGEQPLKCYRGGCCYIASDKKDLIAHRRTHSPDEKYTCDFPGCGQTTPKLCNLKTHQATHTRERPYECGIDGCTYTAGDRGNLKTHQATHTRERPYECGIDGCTYTAARSDDVTKHRRTHTGEKPYECGIDGCTYAATRSDALKTHRKTHTGKKPFVSGVAGKALLPSSQTQSPNLCPILPQHFPESSNALDSNLSPLVVDPADWDATNCVGTPGGLEADTRNQSCMGEQPSVSGIDGRPYATTQSNNLASERKTHTGREPFVCRINECGHVAYTPNILAIHINSKHPGEKPFKCDWEGCTYKTANIGTLKYHIESHKAGVTSAPRAAETRNQKCGIDGCTYVSAHAGILAAHKIKNHTGEKPYKCGIVGCAYTTTRSDNLTKHTRTHTGKKLYKCDFDGCTYAAVQSADLTIHKRKHTGEKPFVSGVASKALLPSPQVQSPKKFICKQCAYATPQVNDYEKHLENCQLK